jgi:YVTN family beta-propeller protein
MTGNGRALHPIGDLTPLGNFPTGSALTPDGRFLWAVDSGHGKDDVRVVEVGSGKVVQTLPLPGGYGGIAFTPDGKRAYVSGSPISGAKPDGPTKGDAGDVLHVFSVDAATGHGSELDPIVLPSSSDGSGQRNSLPPVTKLYPAGLAVSPDGKTVVAALQQADRAALVDVRTGSVRTVQVGAYPNSAAFDRDGRAYVSNAYDGTLSVIDVGAGKVVKTVDGLGGTNSQPEGMVADPRSDRLYVAVTQRDTVAVVDTRSLSVVKTIAIGRPVGPGVQPVALAVDPDGSTLYVADANEDALAAIALTDRVSRSASKRMVYRPPSAASLRRYAAARGRAGRLRTTRARTCGGPTQAQAARYRRDVLRALRGPRARRSRALRAAQRRLPPVRSCPSDGAIAGLKAYELIGKLPTAAYPTSVQVTPDGGRLLWVAGKGFGTGPNPEYVFDGDKRAFGQVTSPYGSYVLDKFVGILGRLSLPTDRGVRSMTKAADAQVVPADAQQAPGGTVVRGDGPIKHVFYIVRENRTYDQVLGSDPRGDGDPSLELFDDNGVAGPTGGITPNAHALARTFPLLDHFYADSEVSVDGHIITAGSIANDYVQKSTAMNYSRPGKSFDFGLFPITFGPSGFVFDQAVRQGISFRNYGEQGAGTAPTAAGRPTYPQVAANTDPAYPNNVLIGCLSAQGAVGNLATCTQDSGRLGATSTTTSVQSRYDLFAQQLAAQLATGTVPRFNYLILPNDHTNGTTPNAYSPQALIADNDLALGQIVDLISHSSIWDSSAIFVVEDDSQDGADHVDAHRMPAFVISPWAKRGVAVHTRYDQYSALRTAEMLAGLQPLSINDGLAAPMYDAFDTTADVEGTRYTAIKPAQPLNEINSQTAPMAAMSRALPFDRLDLVPQALLDRILWAAVHGADSPAPAPGPNASAEEHDRALGALRAIAATGDARAWLAGQAGAAGEEGVAARAAAASAKQLPPSVRAAAAAQARGMLAAMRGQ